MKLSPVSPSRSRRSKDNGRTSPRVVLGITLVGLLALLVNVYSAAPEWWASRGVLDLQQVQDQNAAVNVGQLKSMAARAMAEMNEKFPGGAGTAIHALAQDWRDHKLEHDQSAALNIGQLKAVAKLFYDRLVEAGARPANAGYPWPNNPLADDNDALVNAGQLKNVFSFPIPLINDTDTDGDGMPDGWELANGLNPALDDSLEDNDGDRVPNLFEFKRGTRGNDPNSTPTATLVVSRELGGVGTTDNIYTTIKEALDQTIPPLNAYAVIQVKSGVYAEQVLINRAPVLLLGELGNAQGPPVIIGNLASSAYALYLSTASVVDGFIIAHTPARSGGGVSVSAGALAPRRRLINCVIRGNESSSGGGISNNGAKLDVVHCTITGNKGTSNGRGIYNNTASTLNLVNSIVWGNTGSAPQEIYKYPHASSSVTVSGGSIPAAATSIVAYGEHGGINTDPQLAPTGCLKSSSPAINRSGVAVATASKMDIHGEPRPAVGTAPDLGADEFKDSNGDGLPDWFEGPDDNDGLAALDEYLIYGTNPLQADTDGDGVSDGVELAQGTDPLDDYYHAQPPTLRFVGGGNQWGVAGTVLATPISLSINNGVINAPVTFTASDGGLISADGVGNWQSTLPILTNATLNVPGSTALKVAQVFVKLPDSIGASTLITASVTTGGKTVTAGTWAATFDPALLPPTDLVAIPTAPDTVRLSWTPADLTKATTIEVSSDGGATWSIVGVANAGVVFASIDRLTPDKGVIFRARTGGIPTSVDNGTEIVLTAQNQSSTPPSSSVTSPPSGSSSSITPLSKPTLFVNSTAFIGTKWGHLGLQDTTHSFLSSHMVKVRGYTIAGSGVVSSSTTAGTMDIDSKTGAETYTPPLANGGLVWIRNLTGYNVTSDTAATQILNGGGNVSGGTTTTVQLSVPYTMEDLIRHMEGVKNAAGETVEASWVPPFKNEFIQETKPTPLNQYNEYAPGRASALIRITYPRYDLTFDRTVLGGYEIKKLQYKWQVNNDPNLVVHWLEIFTPDDGTAPIIEPKTWPSEGRTESATYLIDPSLRNDRKNGVYRVVHIQIIDTKDKFFDDQLTSNSVITDVTRDVSIQTKASMQEQNNKSIAWIEPHGSEDNANAPDMPQLALRFTGAERLGLLIKWKLQVVYSRPRGENTDEERMTSQDSVYIPKKTNAEQGQPWKQEALDGAIEFFNHQDWMSEVQKGLFGGEAQLIYQILKSDGSALSNEKTMLFSIGGKNPNDTLCKQYITDLCTATDARFSLSYAVARHESKDYNDGVDGQRNTRYNQFWEGSGRRYNNDHQKGHPLWCHPRSESSAGGFGIFQITGRAKDFTLNNSSFSGKYEVDPNVRPVAGFAKL